MRVNIVFAHFPKFWQELRRNIKTPACTEEDSPSNKRLQSFVDIGPSQPLIRRTFVVHHRVGGLFGTIEAEHGQAPKCVLIIRVERLGKLGRSRAGLAVDNDDARTETSPAFYD